LVHELPEQRVGSVFAQADALAYARDLGVGVHPVSSTSALVNSTEHCFTLLVGKLLRRHYNPFIRSTLSRREGYQRATRLLTRRSCNTALRPAGISPEVTQATPTRYAGVRARVALEQAEELRQMLEALGEVLGG
jgi:hypothetical protein